MPATPLRTWARAQRHLLAVLALSLLTACAGRRAAPAGPGDLVLRWGQRLNVSGPATASEAGRAGERLILVEAEVVTLVMPLGRAPSLEDDRAKAVFAVRQVKGGALPIEYIDLWCPDAVVRERAWQVGTPVTIRLTPENALYDIADRSGR